MMVKVDESYLRNISNQLMFLRDDEITHYSVWVVLDKDENKVIDAHIFIGTASHGYLAVNKKSKHYELAENSTTGYSYYSNDCIFLEEDCEVLKFTEKMREANYTIERQYLYR